MLRTAPALPPPETSWYKQHRTRPCKKRKNGAPTLLEREGKTKRVGHSPAQTLGTLTGYVHTDHISINGVVSPATMTYGTVVPF
jgi:hypothetical protein